jgi:hypothetical protein
VAVEMRYLHNDRMSGNQLFLAIGRVH